MKLLGHGAAAAALSVRDNKRRPQLDTAPCELSNLRCHVTGGHGLPLSVWGVRAYDVMKLFPGQCVGICDGGGGGSIGL